MRERHAVWRDVTARGLAAVLALACAGAGAQSATLVTHSSPGGGGDLFLRTLAKHLGPKMGVDLVVENVRGGSGARAVARVAQAKPDGSVLYAATPTYIQTTLLSRPRHGYDSLEPVAILFFDPELIFARAGAPFRTLAEAIEHAKRSVGKARWGASNPASLERIAMERLNRLTNAGAIVVSHEGGGEQMIGVLNGSYDLGIGETMELRAQLQAKKLRLLAVLSAARIPSHPELPTAREQGIDLVLTKFRGLAGPRGLPPDVLQAWARGIQAVLADPAYRAEYLRDGLVPAYMGHAEARAYTAGYAAQVGAALREFGLVR